MPIPISSAPRAWTHSNIANLKPGISGIYAIVTIHFEFIYIAQAKDLRERLLRHFNLISAQGLRISKYNPAFFYIIEDIYHMDEEEADLISELDPICNRPKY